MDSGYEEKSRKCNRGMKRNKISIVKLSEVRRVGK